MRLAARWSALHSINGVQVFNTESHFQSDRERVYMLVCHYATEISGDRIPDRPIDRSQDLTDRQTRTGGRCVIECWANACPVRNHLPYCAQSAERDPKCRSEQKRSSQCVADPSNRTHGRVIPESRLLAAPRSTGKLPSQCGPTRDPARHPEDRSESSAKSGSNEHAIRNAPGQGAPRPVFPA